jgi:alkylation response protein AidB-like acyl-CoA dehydrogenase
MERHIYPNEQRHVEEAEALGPWKVLPIFDELNPKARAEGLWNLFLPQSENGAGLTNLEYAPLCEIRGRWLLSPRGVQLLGAGHPRQQPLKFQTEWNAVLAIDAGTVCFGHR